MQLNLYAHIKRIAFQLVVSCSHNPRLNENGTSADDLKRQVSHSLLMTVSFIKKIKDISSCIFISTRIAQNLFRSLTAGNGKTYIKKKCAEHVFMLSGDGFSDIKTH